MQWCDRRSIVTKKISLLAMLLSLSMVFSYFEARFPIITWIPGAKLGLANIVVMVALYEIGTKEAWCLSVLRVILTGFESWWHVSIKALHQDIYDVCQHIGWHIA